MDRLLDQECQVVAVLEVVQDQEDHRCQVVVPWAEDNSIANLINSENNDRFS